jgi:hypothetical protein
MLNKFLRPCFLLLDPCSPALPPAALLGFGELLADCLSFWLVPPGLISNEDVYPPTKIMLCCFEIRFFWMFIADSPLFSLLNEAKLIADFWLFNTFFLEEFRCEERGEAPESD